MVGDRFQAKEVDGGTIRQGAIIAAEPNRRFAARKRPVEGQLREGQDQRGRTEDRHQPFAGLS